MLGKILKYELKATARIFALIYAALLALAAINGINIALSDGANFDFGDQLGKTIYSSMSSLMVFLYVTVVIAVFVVTIIIIIIRFYRMYGNEGYLWHTLPVTSDQHILGKLIVAFIWTLASCVVTFISIYLLTFTEDWVGAFREFVGLWNEARVAGYNPGLWLALLICLSVTGWLSSVLMFFAAVAIGPNIIKSRLGGTVLAYLILYIALQILSTIFLTVFAAPLIDQATIASNSFFANGVENAAASINRLMIIFVGGFSALSLVLAGVFYFLARFFTARKLNLP